MEKRGPDPLILLLCLIALLAVGVLFWRLALEGDVTGKASFGPPSYSEFVTMSICENPALGSVAPFDIDQRCDDEGDMLTPLENSP